MLSGNILKEVTALIIEAEKEDEKANDPPEGDCSDKNNRIS